MTKKSSDYKNLIQFYRSREDYQRAENRLLLQIKAMCRRIARESLIFPARPKTSTKKQEAQYAKRYKTWLADTREGADKLYKQAAKGKASLGVAVRVDPMLGFYKGSVQARKVFEGQLLNQAEHVLPKHVLEWCGSTKGFGLLSLAKIAAEAGGPLENYGNPTRLWKRFGLAVIDGKAQRRTKDKVLAVKYGFPPTRRAVMHVVGECLLRARGEYAKVYRERKALEQKKAPELTKIHIHRRALRYTEKCLLRDLWVVWNQAQVKRKAA
jgi:hypothetical protein